MRLRTVAASAVFVLCAAAGAAACSVPSDASDRSRPAGPAASADPAPVEGMTGNIETGKRQAGPPRMEGQSAAGPSECAVPVDRIPVECALDLSFDESSDGELASGAPDAQ
ncbi:hypothetical protein ACFY9Q_15655 [Streptomyces sp. NPDC012389]|uniref:hypothetical protein n=1 Tax=Streptomyces sp. NPDC012389 TaxID=3364830 RepID=UPI0036F04DE0